MTVPQAATGRAPAAGGPRLWLTAAGESPTRVARTVRAGAAPAASGPRRWLYLGRSYDLVTRWEQALGPDFTRISSGAQLQAVAGASRLPYLAWIGRMGSRHPSLAWWTSTVAERNTMAASTLFHSICYLRLGLSLVGEADPPVLIVGESQAVLKTLAEHPALRGRVRWMTARRTPPFAALWCLRFIYKWTAYAIDAVRAQWDARATRFGRPPGPWSADRPRVLLHSCLDDDYFGPDGTARDRYYPGLEERLVRMGYDVVTVPWLFNLKRSRREAFAWFRRQGPRYLIPEDFYRLRDYLWAATVVLSQARLPAGADTFQDLGVARLVREARLRQAADPSSAKFIRYTRLVERCARRGIRVDVFIDMFENSATEKPAVMAFRRWMPGVLTVGYQHYLSMFPLLLSLFTTEAEAAVAPHPDVIVSSSRLGAEQLARAGFSPGRIRIGPALRYQYLRDRPRPAGPAGHTVLAIVPMDYAAMREFMSKIIEALRGDSDLTVWLKIHPMVSTETFRASLGGQTLPPAWTIVGGTLGDWLGRAGCVVVMASTSAFEVALNAVPTVMIGRETDFDFNALAWFPDVVTLARDPMEIGSRVRAELSAPPERRQTLARWAAAMLDRAVGPLTDDSVRVFVQPEGEREPSGHLAAEIES